ncbi:MAG TPA: hypothetical protein PKA88_12930 [Polyangiaceae bacterium]|nr:hypothetical protein [Polyangiaceae bacterium]HMR73621.1 hypothetical protein [Polyangiaceae bacterium]
MSLAPRNPRLLAELVPFVVATPENRKHLDLSPFGLSVTPEHVFDPLKTRAAPFLELLRRLDTLTFGPEGMPMPRWVFVDGAELPGGIAGFGCLTKRLSAEARALIAPPDDYAGLVPLSMFIAIPTHQRGTWLGHNLASLAPQIPGDKLSGLGGLTKATGLSVYRAARQIGVTQWASRALHIHTRMGPLELLTAWTPAHSEAWSLTYRVELETETLYHLARDPRGKVARPKPESHLDSADHEAMQALQDRIEAGEHWCIVGAPEVLEPGRQRVPISRIAGRA